MDQRTVYKSINNGASWAALGDSVAGRVSRLCSNKGDVWIMGTTEHGIYKSTDAGATWSQVEDASVIGEVFDIAYGADCPAPAIYVGTIVYV
jgi:hypothetical protein